MASFQLKNFVSIAASMINRMRATQTAITDFNVGAIGRTLVEAPAIEIDELYQQAFNLVTAAIPVSVYTSFNFPALTALAATGLVRVTITAQTVATLISSGTQFATTTTSVIYAADADTTIAAGATYADVQVTATTMGADTNLSAGASFSTTPSINGMVSATNLSAFVNGRDAETDDERLIRFNDYISTLPRGTVAALEYGLSTVTVLDNTGNIIEQVRLSKIIEPYLEDPTQPIALVDAYIHNGVGNTSGALLQAAVQVITGYTNASGTKVPGYKAAGVPVNVYIAAEQPLDVTGVVSLEPNVDWPTVQAAVQTAIFSYLQGLGIGVEAIYSELITLIMNVAGVADVQLSAPTANTTPSESTKIMPGTLTFTQAGSAP